MRCYDPFHHIQNIDIYCIWYTFPYTCYISQVIEYESFGEKWRNIKKRERERVWVNAEVQRTKGRFKFGLTIISITLWLLLPRVECTIYRCWAVEIFCANISQFYFNRIHNKGIANSNEQFNVREINQ